ncbi:MAG: hypothetical protein NZZ41_08250, partial [Candidatus Dojkabacteria bacterium]|nr:hypothetical protein [Candidatus Dojkabacteria bacterium]
ILKFLDKNGDGIVDTDQWGLLKVAFSGETGAGQPQLLSTGTVQNEPVNPPNSGVTGTYAWYRLFNFTQGSPHSHGLEIKVLLLVAREVTATTNTPSMHLIIPTPYAGSFGTATFISDQFQTSQTTCGISFTNFFSSVGIGGGGPNPPNNDSFILIMFGI